MVKLYNWSTDSRIEELKAITGEVNVDSAIRAAVRFTLMHDKDSVQEALKS